MKILEHTSFQARCRIYGSDFVGLPIYPSNDGRHTGGSPLWPIVNSYEWCTPDDLVLSTQAMRQQRRRTITFRSRWTILRSWR
jgi:hypothetical protein